MKITEEFLSKGEWIDEYIFRYRPTNKKSTVIYKLIKCKYCGEKCFVTPVTANEGYCDYSCSSKLKSVKDLTGIKFNRLTVLYKTKQDSSGRWYWMCKCDCGNLKEVIGSALPCGNTKSCGCLQKEIKIGNKYSYKNGMRNNSKAASYDAYAITLMSVGEKVKRNKENPIILECACKYCGNIFVPTRGQVRGRVDFINGKNIYEQNLYCSNLCKSVCPIYNKTEIAYLNSFNESSVPLNREVQPELRQMVFERDSYQCQRCEKTKVSLHCHHFEGIELNPIESADLDNCITLCVPCHELAHSEIGCRRIDMRRKKCQ
jgi:5-methylcytosine-specific restriction endonuclease McrA